ncbi:MAG TPA: sulfatase [Chitinophagaceae bacterium]|nr:sulfatase [Chitinophagaceae bacterium]
MHLNKNFIFAVLYVSGLWACNPPVHNPQKINRQTSPNILFLFADDWGWPNTGVYGDTLIRTPTFDSLAHAGMLFTRAYCASPSCSPSRAAVLTGQYPHRLESGSQLWGTLPKKFPTYTRLLKKVGYLVGEYQKGYGPANIEAGGYIKNPAGKSYKSFAAFLDSLKPGEPFCFWYGSHDPHRPYQKGSGENMGMDPGKVQVPAYLPDQPEVRRDLLDYYFEVERFDHDCEQAIALLREKGLLKNTLIVMSGDNGKPFPRAKANLYEEGTHIPLAIAWPGKVKEGSICDRFVNLADLAPTFLECAGLKIPEQMTGQSLLSILRGKSKGKNRARVYLEIERHAYVRPDNAGYPMRGIRTDNFLYIRNFEPERWPAGDPEMVFSVGPYGDCDPSPSKDYILTHRSQRPGGEAAGVSQQLPTYYQLAFGKRPVEEFYDLRNDPYELHNVSGEKAYQMRLLEFRQQLQNWMWATNDPRSMDPHTDIFNHYPYYGRAGW